MSTRRERAKAQIHQQGCKQTVVQKQSIVKEKLILESGKFCLDMAKLIFGGVILASVMQQHLNVWLPISIGIGAIVALIILGLVLISKLN